MRKKKIKPGILFIHLILVLVCVVALYPILLIFFNAISSESYVVEHGYVYWPKEISFDAFKAILMVPAQLISSFLVTIYDAVLGQILGMLISAMAGYAMYRDDFILKKPVKLYLMLAMFLPGGGMIPSYIINTTIFHFENNLMAYLLTGLTAPMTIFLYRTYFKSIPKELVESAQIDGATEWNILGKIMLPLSKAFMATQFFMGMSGKWKEFGTTLYYMSDPRLYNLEYYIQQVIKDVNILKEAAIMAGEDPTKFPTTTLSFAVVFVALIPVMIIFPLLQKYFEKGFVVGSVKG